MSQEKMNVQNEAEEMTAEKVSEILQIRRDKLSALKESGRDPFEEVKYDVTATSKEIVANYKDEDDEVPAEEKTLQRIAGRMMSRRIMGKASFAHINDGEGKIQVYIKRDEVGEEDYAEFKKWDIGDILGIEGYAFRTKTGEISIHAKKIKLLAKSLLPLPEKFHGLKDTDLRYRQRYVDLIMNPDVKETFVKRSQILKETRAFLDNKGFLEVDTPILLPIEIAASARHFKTHHNALDIDMYLRIETELYLK